MFIKNDNEFICLNCNNRVSKLKYTSRDHCNFCLYSIHVDIEPGDRLNDCKGMLIPINVENSSKKGQVIIYKCSKCGKILKNIIADDDDREKIYEIVKKYSLNLNNGGKN